jgi:hypothetical protein
MRDEFRLAFLEDNREDVSAASDAHVALIPATSVPGTAGARRVTFARM